MATLNAADDTIPNHLKYQAAICFSFSVLCTTTASKISPGAYLVYMAGCGAASAFFFVLTLCRILKGRTAQNAVRPVAVTMGQVEQPSLAVMAESTTVEGLGATYISSPLACGTAWQTSFRTWATITPTSAERRPGQISMCLAMPSSTAGRVAASRWAYVNVNCWKRLKL